LYRNELPSEAAIAVMARYDQVAATQKTLRQSKGAINRFLCDGFAQAAERAGTEPLRRNPGKFRPIARSVDTTDPDAILSA
jgi:hypothetical protein